MMTLNLITSHHSFFLCFCHDLRFCINEDKIDMQVQRMLLQMDLVSKFCSRLDWVKISLQSQFLPNPTMLNIFLKEDEDFKAMGMKETSATF
ncbi:unnamed protein product [Lactuca virosa]|uniref:Uncharacterized protein n=1 Tax=Lactuca virosa TaxID=75947 RepID=A0AAU9N7B5_9ASTR|nr:unnamed protein product [Lactuca virosa]